MCWPLLSFRILTIVGAGSGLRTKCQEMGGQNFCSHFTLTEYFKCKVVYDKVSEPDPFKIVTWIHSPTLRSLIYISTPVKESLLKVNQDLFNRILGDSLRQPQPRR